MERNELVKRLEKLSRTELEDIAKKRLGLKVRADFSTTTWKHVQDRDLIDKIADICIQNNIFLNIYFKDLHKRVLYKNQDGFIIQKRLGDIHYFEEILKSALKKYGLSETPDYEELSQIATIVYNYIRTVRFDNALKYPVYPNASHLPRIESIAKKLSTVIQKRKSYSRFFASITKAFDRADSAYYSDVMSR